MRLPSLSTAYGVCVHVLLRVHTVWDSAGPGAQSAIDKMYNDQRTDGCTLTAGKCITALAAQVNFVIDGLNRDVNRCTVAC